MKHLFSRSARCAAGFSMVEVALALLILSIGVLTMVGLMSGGLDMSKSAVDYTQTAIFGSDTLEGVRYTASTITNASTATGGTAFWKGLQSVNLQPVAYSQWSSPPATIKNCVAPFTPMKTYWYAPDSSNVDFSCRYLISVDQFPGLTSNLVDQVASVKLDVVNGLYGAATTQSFYTEIIQFAR